MAVTHAPFINGELQEYVGSNYPSPFSERKWLGKDDEGHYISEVIQGEWREIKMFSSFMFYDGWYKGRSAVRTWWKDQDGHRWPMFMKDFDDILTRGKLGSSQSNGQAVGSSVFGFWTIQKRGANYGIRLLDVDEN